MRHKKPLSARPDKMLLPHRKKSAGGEKSDGQGCSAPLYTASHTDGTRCGGQRRSTDRTAGRPWKGRGCREVLLALFGAKASAMKRRRRKPEKKSLTLSGKGARKNARHGRKRPKPSDLPDGNGSVADFSAGSLASRWCGIASYEAGSLKSQDVIEKGCAGGRAWRVDGLGTGHLESRSVDASSEMPSVEI